MLWVSCLNLAIHNDISCINHTFIPNLKDKDIEMKENEIYGVSMAALQAKRQQPLMPDVDDALMSRNVCYATTQHMEIVDNECYGHSVQHMEIVDNECYGCVPEN